MLIDQSDPVSSAEFATFDIEQQSRADHRHTRLAEWLKSAGYDGALLLDPANQTWLSGGADFHRSGFCQPAAAMFVTPESRVILCNNAASPRIFEQLVGGLRFQVKQRPWHEAPNVLRQDLCRGRKVVADRVTTGTEAQPEAFRNLRWPLDDYDISTLRQAARIVTHAVEATARSWYPGKSEAEIAGEVTHRMMRHQMDPVRLQVFGDGRCRRFRDWSWSDAEVFHTLTLSVVGRYRGLHVGVARTVAEGPVPEALQTAWEQVSVVGATALFFSQTGWTMQEVWSRVKRIYEKCGAAGEWELAPQGELLDYSSCCGVLGPSTNLTLPESAALFWHPSIGPIAAGETVLTSARGTEILTTSEDWPTAEVHIKGTTLNMPAIQVRSAGL